MMVYVLRAECEDPGAPWESQFQCANLRNRVDTGAFHKEFTFMIEYINVGFKKKPSSNIWHIINSSNSYHILQCNKSL